MASMSKNDFIWAKFVGFYPGSQGNVPSISGSCQEPGDRRQIPLQRRSRAPSARAGLGILKNGEGGLAREKKNYLISLGELIGPLGAKMPAGAEGGSVLVDIPLSSRAREHPYMQLGALISGFIQISRKLEQAPYLLADTRIPSVSLYDHLALTAGLAAVPARELLQPGGSRRRCVG